MSSKSIIVQVSIYDDDTGLVEQTIVKPYDARYAWDTVDMFEYLGKQVAKILDPSYYEE